MKHIFLYLVTILFISSCSSTKNASTKKEKSINNVQITKPEVDDGDNRQNDPDGVEYEIDVLAPGFDLYLNTIARPINYYPLSYYQNKNTFFVVEWNIRAQNPLQYNDLIYQQTIDYDSSVDYGLEVNYKLYYFFKYMENKYDINLLGGGDPRPY